MIDQYPLTICTLFVRKQGMSILTKSDWWPLTFIDGTSQKAVLWSL